MGQVTADQIEEMHALIESGDLVLAQERVKFKRVMGRETALTDEQLIRAIAATDDDDDELFCKNVVAIEQQL